MAKIRVTVTFFGLGMAALGIAHLIFLVTVVRRYGGYPPGEHLFGGGLFIAGALVVIFGNYLCDWYENYQERKDEIKLSSDYFK
ncbi:MAG: hypothetical protein U9Q85_03875 [Patescibacteria group bacterium]|nr:hypothetical protein [Patescibacteria group bacterium]